MQAGVWRYLGPLAESWLVAASWLVLLLLGALLLRVGVLWELEVLLPWVAKEVHHECQVRRLLRRRLRRLLTRSQEVVQASELSWRSFGHEGCCVLPPALLLLPRRAARAALRAPL